MYVCVCQCGDLGIRCDTYMYSLSGFWPTQSQDGTRMTLRLCLELLCRYEHSHGPCSCSSFHLCKELGQKTKILNKCFKQKKPSVCTGGNLADAMDESLLKLASILITLMSHSKEVLKCQTCLLLKDYLVGI